MLDEKTKQELEAKYGDIEIVETPKGVAAFKRLDRRQRNQYLKLIAQNQIGEASDFATLASVVHPERTAFDAWLDARPGIAMQCMHRLAPFNQLAGQEEGKG